MPVTQQISTNQIMKETVAPTQKTKKAEQTEELFTSPPMSKKADGNDIASMWQALLENISSPPTQAMLKLAIPVQISQDGVIIAFKNEIHVSRINDSNKKQIIQDAAKILFNNTEVPITVRLATSSDSVQVKDIPQKAQTPKLKPEAEKDVEVSETKTISETKKEPKTSSEQTIKKTSTDQEKMILDLFEGKYVE